MSSLRSFTIWVVAGVVLVAALGLGAGYAIGRTPDPAAGSPRLAASDGSRRHGKGRPRRDAAASQRRFELPLAAAESSDREAPTPTTPEGPPGVGVGAEAKPDLDKAVKQLVEAVKQEARQAAWARQTESSIRETLEPFVRAETGISMESVYCASVRCVIEGEAASDRMFHEMAPAITQVPGMPRARIRLTRMQDGTFEYRAVLARDGFDVEGAPKGG